MPAIISGKLTDGQRFSRRFDNVNSITEAPAALEDALKGVGKTISDVAVLNTRLLTGTKAAGPLALKPAPVKKEKGDKADKKNKQRPTQASNVKGTSALS